MVGYRIFVLSICFLFAACVAPPEDQTIAVAEPPPPLKQAYRSSKLVSTDCGTDHVSEPPPGFAEGLGRPTKDMPKGIADSMAVGADRELHDTDPTRVAEGYVLIEPVALRESLLIDVNKNVVATFEGDYQGFFTQLLDNGNRLVPTNMYSGVFLDGGGNMGCVEEYSSDGRLLWRLSMNTNDYIQHHDVVKLPNGNILTIVWEKVSKDEVVSQGRDPEKFAENDTFWFDGLIEINPYTLEIVWEWSARYHLIQDFNPHELNYGVVADHPELLDINFTKALRPNQELEPDWTHVNSLDYNAELDQIVFSSNYMSEVFVIDHSTTPFESMGHKGGRYGKGGDILYRWGRPSNYDRGSEDDRKLFAQHDVQWIRPGLPGAGNLLIFNNGYAGARPYTTVVEIRPPMHPDGSYVLPDDGPYGPDSLAWEYDPEPPDRFFSWFISGAQRLPNGNTLVNQGAKGGVREVTTEGEIVWDYLFTNDVDAPHMLFRANKYPASHPGVIALLNKGD